jgi:hypothetical protein
MGLPLCMQWPAAHKRVAGSVASPERLPLRWEHRPIPREPPPLQAAGAACTTHERPCMHSHLMHADMCTACILSKAAPACLKEARVLL